MTKADLLEIIDEEEHEYRYGGSEDSEGNLECGSPDFNRIRKAVKELEGV